MKVGDLVRCKEILKPAGVMGSTLKKYKRFEGFAIIINSKKEWVKIMKNCGSIEIIKSSFLEVVSESR